MCVLVSECHQACFTNKKKSTPFLNLKQTYILLVYCARSCIYTHKHLRSNSGFSKALSKTIKVKFKNPKKCAPLLEVLRSFSLRAKNNFPDAARWLGHQVTSWLFLILLLLLSGEREKFTAFLLFVPCVVQTDFRWMFFFLYFTRWLWLKMLYASLFAEHICLCGFVCLLVVV